MSEQDNRPERDERQHIFHLVRLILLGLFLYTIAAGIGLALATKGAVGSDDPASHPAPPSSTDAQ